MATRLTRRIKVLISLTKTPLNPLMGNQQAGRSAPLARAIAPGAGARARTPAGACAHAGARARPRKRPRARPSPVPPSHTHGRNQVRFEGNGEHIAAFVGVGVRP